MTKKLWFPETQPQKYFRPEDHPRNKYDSHFILFFLYKVKLFPFKRFLTFS